MREGEIAKLEWSMLDRGGPTWVLNLPSSITKNGRGRALGLRGEVRSIIERRIKARRLDCPLIFHRTSKGQTGQPLKAFDKLWRKALAAAKLPPDRIFHDLRRSAVRNLIRAGVDPSVGLKISGHRPLDARPLQTSLVRQRRSQASPWPTATFRLNRRSATSKRDNSGTFPLRWERKALSVSAGWQKRVGIVDRVLTEPA